MSSSIGICRMFFAIWKKERKKETRLLEQLSLMQMNYSNYTVDIYVVQFQCRLKSHWKVRWSAGRYYSAVSLFSSSFALQI